MIYPENKHIFFSCVFNLISNTPCRVLGVEHSQHSLGQCLLSVFHTVILSYQIYSISEEKETTFRERQYMQMCSVFRTCFIFPVMSLCPQGGQSTDSEDPVEEVKDDERKEQYGFCNKSTLRHNFSVLTNMTAL